jgi:uncharacterized membrane protein YeiH
MDSQYILILDSIGIIAFTLSGYILASKMSFDLLGIVFISFTSAFAGGVFRDSIVGRIPFIFEASYPLTIALITIVIAYFLKLHIHARITNNKIFLFSDTLGLSTFALTGALVAIEYHLNFGGVLFLSLLTAVGGGIVRDIIMNKIPYILTNEFYGMVSIMIGGLIWLLNILNLLSSITITLVFLFGVAIRLVAIKRSWKLPSLKH